MVIFKFRLSELEYFDYNYFTAWSRPEKKGFRTRYYLRIFLSYCLIAGLFIFINHSEQVVVDIVVFSIIALIYFLSVPALIRHSVRRRVKEILEKPENKHVLEESEIMISDTGIVEKDEASETRYEWSAIVRKAETTDCYLLYTNSFHAVVIPKRVVSNPREKQQFQELLNRHLPLSSEFPAR